MLLTKAEEKSYRKYLKKRGDYKGLLYIYTLPLIRGIYVLKEKLIPAKETVASATNTPIPSLNYTTIYSNCKKYYVDLALLTSEADRVRLAGEKMIGINENPFASKDLQDTHAYNRLYWILDSNIEKKEGKLEQWLDTEFTQHPYDASERIMNIIWFLSYYTELSSSLVQKCINRIYLDASYLKDNIEYHLGVHNHVVNNCRALIAAHNVLQVTETEQPATEARKLMTDYWDKLILDDGFFNEQSTSYHILLTRTFLEFYHDHQLNNLELPTPLKTKGEKMCEVTNKLFNSNSTFTLIGDITPDLPIKWFKGLTIACHNSGLLKAPPVETEKGFAIGVANLFKEKDIPEAEVTDHVKLFPNSGLLVVHQSNLKLVAFVPAQNIIKGHGDAAYVGGYELFYNNHPVVVDGGLLNYTLNSTLLNAKSARNNNTISINGIDAAISNHDYPRLPEGYRKIDDNTIVKGDSFICLKSSGFARNSKNAAWERTFTWYNNTIEVKDSIKSDDKMRVLNTIHLLNNAIDVHYSDKVTSSYVKVARGYGLPAKAIKISHKKKTSDYSFTVKYSSK